MSEEKYATCLLLRVVLPDLQTTDLLNFHPNITIEQIIETIKKKHKIISLISYGLYCSTANGFWLEPQKTIMDYQLWKYPIIEFKKKRTIQVKVKFEEKTESVPIDEGATIANAFQDIKTKFSIDESQNYTLLSERYILDEEWPFVDQEDFLDLEKTVFTLQSKTSGKENSQNLTPIFGSSLSTAVERAGGEGNLPTVITKVFEFVEKNGILTKGIYKTPGRTNNVGKLKEIFNQKEEFDINKFIESPHDATGVLKMYLQDLSGPVIPEQFFNSLLEVAKINELWEQMPRLKKILISLPLINFKVCGIIFKHLYAVSTHSDKNEMGINDLAVSFCPSLVSKSQKLSKSSQMSKNAIRIWSLLIKENGYLFFEQEKNYQPIFAIANHDFEPTNEGDLSVTQGERIQIIKKTDEESDGWWTARNENGDEGMVPSNYFTIISNNDKTLTTSIQKKKGKISGVIDQLTTTLIDRIEKKNELENNFKQINQEMEEIQNEILEEKERISRIVKFLRYKFGENSIENL
ncbi:rho/rac/cdc gtpase-activating protein [Anaeramoeba flamelloides]|uniref:Rho/rac/cdc gtpase-activating protein n=1 Tax=Anaeramoeba flamelloides TaxID=1746091 RepID=A0ABQ8Z393_9EUKA|nr:rho/rac/cdc gtpase-activating protein [Anaeramoeba flamelloides]